MLFFNASSASPQRNDPFYNPERVVDQAVEQAPAAALKSPLHWAVSMHRFSGDHHSAMVICVPDRSARDIGFKLLTAEKIQHVSWQYHGFEGKQSILIAEYKGDNEYGVRVYDHVARAKLPFVIRVTFAESDMPLDKLREVQLWDGEGGEKSLFPLPGLSASTADDSTVPLGRFAFNNGMYTPPATLGQRLGARF